MNDNFYILLVGGIAGIFMITFGSIMLQVRSRNRLLQQQKKLDVAQILHQKKLLEAVIISQETERQRIGSDLHDEVGAVLSSLRMLIEKQGNPDASVISPFTVQCKAMIDQVIDNVRQIAHNLSPYINGANEFYDAVHDLCNTVNLAGKPQLVLDFDEDDMPLHFDVNNCIALFRILAELINNTIKHACAGNVSIKIGKVAGGMHLSYTDDGIGFDYEQQPAGKGMGLQNIESRLAMVHAIWEIRTAKKEGFKIDIKIPVQAKG